MSWLPLVLSVGAQLLGMGIQWGTLGADVRGLDKRTDRAELRLVALEEWRSTQAVNAAELKKDVETTRASVQRIEQAIVNAGAASILQRMPQRRADAVP